MKFLDLTDELQKANEKTTLRLDADHTYVISNTRKTMEIVMAAAKDMETEEDPIKQLDVLDEIIKRVLGKDAAEYTADYSLKAKTVLLDAIAQSIGGDAGKN